MRLDVHHLADGRRATVWRIWRLIGIRIRRKACGHSLTAGLLRVQSSKFAIFVRVSRWVCAWHALSFACFLAAPSRKRRAQIHRLPRQLRRSRSRHRPVPIHPATPSTRRVPAIPDVFREIPATLRLRPTSRVQLRPRPILRPPQHRCPPRPKRRRQQPSALWRKIRRRHSSRQRGTRTFPASSEIAKAAGAARRRRMAWFETWPSTEKAMWLPINGCPSPAAAIVQPKHYLTICWGTRFRNLIAQANTKISQPSGATIRLPLLFQVFAWRSLSQVVPATSAVKP